MKIIKEILGRIFALWALLLFVVTMFIFLIPFFIILTFPEPKRTNAFVLSSRMWMKIFLNGIGCPLTIKGKEHFKKGQNYIVLCNHNSLMDVPVSSPGIPGGNKTIAKIEFAHVPVFGIIYKLGSVLVNRKSEASRRESIHKMKEVLAMGLHMCIYPEGTRNKTEEPLKSFHNGAFKLAIDTGKPIIPGVIFNTKKVLPAGKIFYLWPSRLEMHFLGPVIINDNDTAEGLKTKVFDIMKEHYLITSVK
jgi:1-acyl-sn-glycerol-3-phosphate acyltransferase